MQIDQQLCSIQFASLESVAVFLDICVHYHGQNVMNLIEIENFMQQFKDQILPWIELRLKSQNWNQTKLNYLTKVYQEYFGDRDCCDYGLKTMIEYLINGYKTDIRQVEYNIFQQLTFYGFKSFNFNQQNIPFDNRFINREIEHYQNINLILNGLKDSQLNLKDEILKKLIIFQAKNRYLITFDQIDQVNYATIKLQNSIIVTEKKELPLFCGLFSQKINRYKDFLTIKRSLQKKKNIDLTQRFKLQKLLQQQRNQIRLQLL